MGPAVLQNAKRIKDRERIGRKSEFESKESKDARAGNFACSMRHELDVLLCFTFRAISPTISDKHRV